MIVGAATMVWGEIILECINYIPNGLFKLEEKVDKLLGSGFCDVAGVHTHPK